MYDSFVLPNYFDPQDTPSLNYQLATNQNELERNYENTPLYKKLMKKDISVAKRFERILEPKGFVNSIKLLFEKKEKAHERFENLLITKEVIAKKEETNNIESKL
jgi:hypothetical protein